MVEKIREEFMYMDAVNYISDVLQKTKGKELKVAFLGGSLSKGERVKRELCFVSLFEQKIEERLSNGRKVSVLRYGQSGTERIFPAGVRSGPMQDRFYGSGAAGDRFSRESQLEPI